MVAEPFGDRDGLAAPGCLEPVPDRLGGGEHERVELSAADRCCVDC